MLIPGLAHKMAINREMTITVFQTVSVILKEISIEPAAVCECLE